MWVRRGSLGIGTALGALVIVAAALFPWEGRAQQQAAAPPIAGSPLEMQAYDLYTKNKLVTARTKAEKALAVDPSSIMGHYILGCVLREAEGSLARAIYELGRARELYETRFGMSRAPGAPWGLHREIIYAIQATAGELEEYDYQLEMIDYYDSLYDPALTAEHAWPLLHLRRFDEARQWAVRATKTSDDWQKSLGLNALCAIEGEARTREAHFRACMAALDHARAGARAATESQPADQQVAVHAYNATLAALSALKFDEAEQRALEGAQRMEFTIANPYRLLARFYADAGKMDEAVSSVREMQRWRLRQPANLRDQDRADSDATLATVLLAGGQARVAMRVITRAVERPDRRGLTSASPDQALGGHALLRRSIARAAAEMLAEERSRQGFLRRVGGRFEVMWAHVQSWPDDERVSSVLSDEERLLATLQLYVHGGIEPVPTWLVGDLVDVLGPGVVAVELRKARQDERRLPALRPYYDALEAEVSLAQGDRRRAMELARRSLDGLPVHEALLQARVAAVGAEAARRDGNDALAYGLYERAMQRDPGVLRRLDIELPATVRVRGTGAAVEAAGDMMERSPRFRDDSRGFVIEVTGARDLVRACMRSPMGAQLTCHETRRQPKPEEPREGQAQPATPPPPTPGQPPARPRRPVMEDDDELAARFVEEFHDRAFSVRGTTTSIDLRSLDGSTTGGREATRDQMRNVLEGLAEDQQP